MARPSLDAWTRVLANRPLDARIRLLPYIGAIAGALLCGAAALGGGYALTSMLVIAVAAILVQRSLASAIVRTRVTELASFADTIDAIANGESDVTMPSTIDGSSARLHTSLMKMADRLRESTEEAEAIAEGDLSHSATRHARGDRLGLALVRISAYLSELGTASDRVAEGELGVVVRARSPRDAVGVAFASMLDRITRTLRETGLAARAISAGLTSIEDAIGNLTIEARRTIDVSADVAASVEAIAAQSSRLDALLRPFGPADDHDSVGAGLNPHRGPTLHRTPPSTELAFPKLGLMARCS
jgi:methyl-accepting chemotaxis protein